MRTSEQQLLVNKAKETSRNTETEVTLALQNRLSHRVEEELTYFNGELVNYSYTVPLTQEEEENLHLEEV